MRSPVCLRTDIGLRGEGVRHDLPPKETSQIARVVGRQITVGNKQVLPAVIVDIQKQRTPGPASHKDSGSFADVLEPHVPELLKFVDLENRGEIVAFFLEILFCPLQPVNQTANLYDLAAHFLHSLNSLENRASGSGDILDDYDLGAFLEGALDHAHASMIALFLADYEAIKRSADQM